MNGERNHEEDSSVDALSVEGAKELITRARVGLLRTYWRLGRMATEAQRKNGNRGVSELADKLGLELSTVSASVEFFKFYPAEEDLARAAERGLSWSHIRALIGSKLSEAARVKLEKRVSDERLGVRELTAAVKEFVKRTGQPVVKIPVTPLGVFTKIEQVAEKLRRLLKLYVKVVPKVKDLAGQTKEDTVTARHGAEMELCELGGDIHDLARKDLTIRWWREK